jgi:putative Mg2+ transporter-C (MgtC) family protein
LSSGAPGEGPIRDHRRPYRLSLTVGEEQEAHIRALMLHSLSGGSFSLRALHSEDVDATGRVIVPAEFTGRGPGHGALEQAVSRLSLEPGVSSARWEIQEDALSGRG